MKDDVLHGTKCHKITQQDQVLQVPKFNESSLNEAQMVFEDGVRRRYSFKLLRKTYVWKNQVCKESKLVMSETVHFKQNISKFQNISIFICVWSVSKLWSLKSIEFNSFQFNRLSKGIVSACRK